MRPRVLLVNPWIYDFAAYNLWASPLGLLKVAEHLSCCDVDLFFIDCTDAFEVRQYGIGKYRAQPVPKPVSLEKIPRRYKQYGITRAEFQKRVESCMPADMVLVTSIMSYWYPGAQETIRTVKKILGDIPVVLGGIYPTLYPEHAAAHSGADHIYSGPADDRLFPFLRECGLPLRAARGSRPYYELDLRVQNRFGTLLTSSGCPFQCSYCASQFLSRAYEQRPREDVLKEIAALSGRGIHDFAFYDDALLHDADSHIKPLLRMIIRRRLPVRLHAPNGLHARFLDDALAGLMKESGFRTVRLSFETSDPGRQKRTGGKVSTEDLARAVSALQKHGFTREQIGVYLLFGLPGQGLDEVEEGIAFLQRLDVRIFLAEFSPIRGTACWDELVRDGIIPDDLDPLFTNNTVFSFLYSGYDAGRVNRMKLMVKEYNRKQDIRAWVSESTDR